MTVPDSVRYGNTTIDFTVRRSPRRKKTMQITIGGEGVQVDAPMSASDEELRAFVLRKAPWVLSRAAQSPTWLVRKRFVSGETLPYLGRNVVLVVEPQDARKTSVRFDHWRFRVAVPRALDGVELQARVRKAVVAWYRERAAERLRLNVARWWNRLGTGNQPPIHIRNQRTRWGSCAPDGTLRFNWRTMMLKPDLIDYIVVHEMTHLTHRNHSKEFWSLVRRTMPDAERRRSRLREAGHALPL